MQSPVLHALTLLAFALHIGGGAVGLVSGTVVMAVFACYLAFVIPKQLANVFISVLALYLVSTAWLTIRRRDGTIGLSEKIALLVGLCLCAPFAILSFQLALGLTPLFKSAVPFKGPVLIAIYGFTSVLALAAIGDARVVLAGGISGTVEAAHQAHALLAERGVTIFAPEDGQRRSSFRSSSPWYC